MKRPGPVERAVEREVVATLERLDDDARNAIERRGMLLFRPPDSGTAKPCTQAEEHLIFGAWRSFVPGGPIAPTLDRIRADVRRRRETEAEKREHAERAATAERYAALCRELDEIEARRHECHATDPYLNGALISRRAVVKAEIDRMERGQ